MRKEPEEKDSTLNFEKRKFPREIAKALRPLRGRMVVARVRTRPAGLTVYYLVGKISKICIEDDECFVGFSGVDGVLYRTGVNSVMDRIVIVRPFSEIKKSVKGGQQKLFYLDSQKRICAKAADEMEAAYILYQKTGLTEFSLSELKEKPEIKHY